MNEVFIDASFWVMLILPREIEHRNAVQNWERLLRDDRSITTTNWTLYEAMTIVNGRGRHDLALELLRLARLTVTIVDAAQFESDTLNVFTSHDDKRWSVVDCANFICIKNRSSNYALSFDSDFAQAQGEFGFTLLGAVS
jgi:predicted nucleic acid-binding protein